MTYLWPASRMPTPTNYFDWFQLNYEYIFEILTKWLTFQQVKLEPRSPAKPSRVVHIRNIPNDVTEAEIVHLGIPFGRVTNVLVLKGKNQVRWTVELVAIEFKWKLDRNVSLLELRREPVIFVTLVLTLSRCLHILLHFYTCNSTSQGIQMDKIT